MFIAPDEAEGMSDGLYPEELECAGEASRGLEEPSLRMPSSKSAALPVQIEMIVAADRVYS